jgi:WD40 repeat protein
LRILDALDHEVFALAWSPDGRQLATLAFVERNKSSTRWQVALWDARTGKKLHAFAYDRELDHGISPPAPPDLQMAFRPDGKELAIDTGKKVAFYDTASGTLLQTLPWPANGPLAWRPDGKRLAVLGKNETQKNIIQVWDVKAAQVVQTIKDRQGGIAAILWSPDGKRLFSGGRDNTIKVWNMEDGGSELLTLSGPSSRLSWTLDGKQLLSTGVGGPKLWRTAGHDAQPRRVAERR